MGPIEVEAARYWGAQTQRSLHHFAIGARTRPHAARGDPRVGHPQEGRGARQRGARRPHRRGRLRSSSPAADEVIAGTLDDHFPLRVWQTGTGTQTNMNVERGHLEPRHRAGRRRAGLEEAGPPERRREHVAVVERHVPDRDAHRRGARSSCTGCSPSVRALRDALAAQARGVRRHREDRPHAPAGRGAAHARARSSAATSPSSTPTSARIEATLPGLYELAIGGTAVGTGLNAHPGFARACAAAKIAELTGLPFVTAPNKFAALAAHDALVFAARRARARWPPRS